MLPDYSERCACGYLNARPSNYARHLNKCDVARACYAQMIAGLAKQVHCMRRNDVAALSSVSSAEDQMRATTGRKRGASEMERMSAVSVDVDATTTGNLNSTISSTVNNHISTTTNQQTNVHHQVINNWGKEYVGHITEDKMYKWTKDPTTAVMQMAMAVHAEPQNHNVKIMSQRRNEYSVYDAHPVYDNISCWVARPKDKLLEDMFHANVQRLEDKITGETRDGELFLKFVDTVREGCMDDEKDKKKQKLYKDQLRNMESVVQQIHAYKTNN